MSKNNKPETKPDTKAKKPKAFDPKELETELESLDDAELLDFAKEECPELVKEAGDDWDELTTEQKAAAILARIKKDKEPVVEDDEDDEVGEGYRLGDKSSTGVDVLGPNGERIRTYTSADHGIGFMKLAKQFVEKRNSLLSSEEK